MSDEQGDTERPTGEQAVDPGGNGAPESADRADDGGVTADEAAAAADEGVATGGEGDAAVRSADGATETRASDAGEPPVGAIADRVADEDPAAVAAEIAELRETVREREADLAEVRTDRADLEDRYKRKAAEFQNYKKRQEKRREEVRKRATEALVEDLLEVRDNLDRALDQEDDADIREGVEATSRQLDEVLDGERVEPIEPAPGADVDPARHEVLVNVDSDQPAGTVAAVHRPGYAMAGKVLRPAQVTVAEGDPE
jgi:molecular chaperone GrpE